MFKFELGTRVRDWVTGYEGIITARVEHLNGCKRYGVQGPVKDGKIPDLEWLDEEQLELVEEKGTVEKSSTGGPHPAPKSMESPPSSSWNNPR